MNAGYNEQNLTTKIIRRIKLEYGNVSTDWSPAPEDATAGGGAAMPFKIAVVEFNGGYSADLTAGKISEIAECSMVVVVNSDFNKNDDPSTSYPLILIRAVAPDTRFFNFSIGDSIYSIIGVLDETNNIFNLYRRNPYSLNRNTAAVSLSDTIAIEESDPKPAGIESADKAGPVVEQSKMNK